MGRPKREMREQDSQERILMAAEQAFAAHGYGDTRLEDIAKAAGMRRPSLLYHFESKERLYGEVVTRAFTALEVNLIAAFDAPGTFTDKWNTLVDGFVALVDERPHLARLFFRELLDGQGVGADMIRKQVVPLFRGLELFFSISGQTPTIPIREMVMVVASHVFARAAAGQLRSLLWGTEDHTREISHALLTAFAQRTQEVHSGVTRSTAS